MKHKSKAFKKLKNWKVEVENQTDKKKIKYLRIDNRIEYKNT